MVILVRGGQWERKGSLVWWETSPFVHVGPIRVGQWRAATHLYTEPLCHDLFVLGEECLAELLLFLEGVELGVQRSPVDYLVEPLLDLRQ